MKSSNSKTRLNQFAPWDYPDYIKDKYYEIKDKICATAQHMIESDTEVEFENKLKAMCQMKKEMFSIENEDAKNARKRNGEINYQIRLLKIKLDAVDSELNLENVTKYGITIEGE